MFNKVKVVGMTTGIMEVNHRFEGNNGEYITALETEIVYTSANQVSNTIKVIMLENSLSAKHLSVKGKLVEIEGALRTFNKNSWGKRITEVYLAPEYVKVVTLSTRQQNVVKLTGTICGKVHLKKRTTGKVVAEGKLKVEKRNGYDYIPLVAFGDEAYTLHDMNVEQEINLKGRIHSRTFNFKYEENGEKKEVLRTALEVGIHVLTAEKEVEKKDFSIHSLMDFAVLTVATKKNIASLSNKHTYEAVKIPKGFTAYKA